MLYSNGFESEKGFLDSNLTIGILAKRFNTNTRYLSSVIVAFPFLGHLKIR